jgi:hypothetical protein
MSPVVQGFGRRPLLTRSEHLGRRPEAAKERNRGKGYVDERGVRYGKLRGTESFGMEPISTAGGLEGVHNFDVMA